MSVIVRFVHINQTEVDICEHFIGFLPVSDTTRLGLTQTFLEFLNNNQISLKDCRGQGYDNGSNMKGKMLVCKPES